MSLTSGVKLNIHLLNVVVRFIVFLTSATLIFRGTDISKCFRESLGIRDNESRLISMTILSLPLIHEGKFSVSAESMSTSTGSPIRGLSLPRNSLSRLTESTRHDPNWLTGP